MTLNRIDPGDIERIVGAPRASRVHIGHAITAESMLYVMHSQECLDSGIVHTDCIYAQALDREINPEAWIGFANQPVVLRVWDGRLIPDRGVSRRMFPRDERGHG